VVAAGNGHPRHLGAGFGPRNFRRTTDFQKGKSSRSSSTRRCRGLGRGGAKRQKERGSIGRRHAGATITSPSGVRHSFEIDQSRSVRCFRRFLDEIATGRCGAGAKRFRSFKAFRTQPSATWIPLWTRNWNESLAPMIKVPCVRGRGPQDRRCRQRQSHSVLNWSSAKRNDPDAMTARSDQVRVSHPLYGGKKRVLTGFPETVEAMEEDD